MSIASLSNLLKLFGGSKPSEEEKRALVKEATLMALARCTSADSNIKQVEVETVREIVERLTGEAVSDEDVRIAANSAAFERAPLSRYLASVGRNVDVKDRLLILRGLEEVIRSDDRVSSREVEFFNMVADALQISPAEAVGLIAE